MSVQCRQYPRPLDFTGTVRRGKIFNIKLDQKFAKLYEGIKFAGDEKLREVYECLMTLEYSRMPPPPGFPHYVFRDKTSHHVTQPALGASNFRGALISRLGQIYDRMLGCVSSFLRRGRPEAARCSSKYTTVQIRPPVIPSAP